MRGEASGGRRSGRYGIVKKYHDVGRIRFDKHFLLIRVAPWLPVARKEAVKENL